MESLIKELRQALGRRYVMERPEELLVYEYDASIERAAPQIVAVPADTEQVSSASPGNTVYRWCHAAPGPASAAALSLYRAGYSCPLLA